MDGVIALYKERGMTSHDCVFKLRKILHTKKIGHTGTLDPSVDGVLPICVGAATKVSEILMGSGKVYQGSIRLGVAYDTEDLDGQQIEVQELVGPVSDDAINSGLKQLTGDVQQIPPMYSAVKVNGRKLYEYAREGIEIERQPRTIHVDYFKQTKPSVFNEDEHTQEIFFEVGCSKGTYVRTLATDLGKELGLPAVMSSLTRIKSGGFSLSETSSLADVEEAMANESLAEVLHPLERVLDKYPIVDLTEEQWQLVNDGVFLPTDVIVENPTVIRLDYQNKVTALYSLDTDKNMYRPFKMFLNRG
ncbi:tRNA pseudouridine(55) synthase TruB [Lentilactobacillus sp. Marseille-Q4993]|uniref:tRNA pseudouridine(55) synthase TruB n=1 Tax=Lentilactobacillus sp. Marseille-Q4993 TaxID=3039492 RepID=UPI0024BCF6E3|nr:tRNA pseudouridine(55) synthase TruB [Lentilactobacillus sp. Marseille-Q4993]